MPAVSRFPDGSVCKGWNALRVAGAATSAAIAEPSLDVERRALLAFVRRAFRFGIALLQVRSDAALGIQVRDS